MKPMDNMISMIKGQRHNRRLQTVIGVLAVLAGVSIFSYAATAQVVPTNEWVNFYSEGGLTVNGEPVPVGAVVNAYDPDGILAGSFTVTTEGSYGLMPVYRDDPDTELDEGADPGDAIRFEVDGIEASVTNSVDPVWNANGDVYEVDLTIDTPQIEVQTNAVAFGLVARSEEKSLSVDVTNSGNNDLVIDSLSIDYHFPEHLTGTIGSTTITSGATTQLDLSLAPLLGKGEVNGTVTLYSNSYQGGETTISFSATIDPEIAETNEWINVLSNGTTQLDGQSVIPGDVVDAYDPDGVLAGTYVVQEAGSFGLLSVYRDDPDTELDEGADPGDIISFRVNGFVAQTVSSDGVTWTENGAVFEVGLNAVTQLRPTLSTVSFTLEEDGSHTFTSAHFEAGYSDGNADALHSIRIDSLPKYGSLTWNEQIVIKGDTIPKAEILGLSYQPDADFHGLDGLYWNATDGKDFAETNTEAQFQISPVNDAPVIKELPDFVFDEDQELVVDLDTLVTDIDTDTTNISWLVSIDESALSKAAFSYRKHEFGIVINDVDNDSLTIIIDPDTKVTTFRAAPNFNRLGIPLLFTATDDGDASDTKPTTLHVNAVNDAPVLVAELPELVTIQTNESDSILIWQFVEDLETPDSQLRFSVETTPEPEGFAISYNNSTGYLKINAGELTGEYENIVTATDDGGLFVRDTINVTVEQSTSIGEEPSDLPNEFTLEQNYPNPFNPSTTIRYGIPEAADVRLMVYDLLGRQVATLVSGRHNAGFHTVQFNASRLATGIYIYRIEAGDFVQTRKLMLIK